MNTFPEFNLLISGIEHELQKQVDSDHGRVQKIDVVINIYGKPFNTAATLYSLLKHSGKWIDKIYFITERKQPHNSNFEFIKQALGNKLIIFTPPLWLWVRPFYNKFLFRLRPFRRSVRYQYGWEKTDKDFLFISHNDVLYTSDIIGAMLARVGDHIGIGPVGQCWNCSAHFAGICTPDTFTQYKPSYKELVQLLNEYPAPRRKDYGSLPQKDRPWPLPECRLNEWTALVNMKMARGITMPLGSVIPFGSFYELDVNTKWFSEVHNMGHVVANFNIAGFAQHAWASSGNNGHSALFNEHEYTFSEGMAEDYLRNELEKQKSGL